MATKKSSKTEEHIPPTGPSLRDYFAGQILSGALTVPPADWSPTEIAIRAYAIADAAVKQQAMGPTE